MVKRHIVQPMMSYRDPDGRMRHALSGEDVDVHPDFLEDFDAVNDPDRVSTPKARGPATTDPSPTSRRTVRKQVAKAAGREPTPRK